MALESSALNNNETRAPAMLAIVWTECALGIVFIILRFWCRYRIRALGIDDWIMSFSVALTIVTASLITVLAQNGGFRHLASLPADTHSRAVKLDWIEQPSMVFNFGVSKVSTSLLILRLMSPNSKKTRRLLYFIIAITTLLTTLAVIFIFAQCKPPRALWTPNIPAKCWRPEDYSSFTLGQGAWYILVDFLLAIIPSFIIWNLKMKRTKRIGLSIVFSFGVLAGICGCAKMPTLKNLNSRSDITWVMFPLYALTVTEISLIIYAGCIPTLGPLYDYLINSKISTSRHSNNHSNSNSKGISLERGHAVKLGSRSSTDEERLATSTHVTGPIA